MKKTNSIKLGSLILALTLHTSLVEAKVETFDVLKKKVSLDVPSDWEVINKEVGIPLKLVGPLHEEYRPVLLVVPLDVKEDRMNFKDEAAAQESYKVSKLAWLQSVNAKLISFLPMKTFKAGNAEFHQFTYLYQMKDENYEEKSFYVKCKDQTFHMKTLLKMEHAGKWESTIKPLVESFNCK